MSLSLTLIPCCPTTFPKTHLQFSVLSLVFSFSFVLMVCGMMLFPTMIAVLTLSKNHVQFSVLSLVFFICFDALWDDALSYHDCGPNPFQKPCSVFSFEFGIFHLF